MKVLYFSCHEILSYDETTLLTELGHQVFSPDSRVSDDNPGDPTLRPGIPKCDNYDELMAEWHTFGQPGKDNKENVSSSFIKKFDVVLVMHLFSKWVSPNWQAYKDAGVPVILRTIGQNVYGNEMDIKPFRDQIKIIRYSPREKLIPGYVGEDVLIRFYKDPNEFKEYTGEIEKGIVIAQSLAEPQRREWCGYEFLTKLMAPLPHNFIGTGSEKIPNGLGKLPYSELKQAMRQYRFAGVFGTYPASYVLSALELLITGMPILSVKEGGHPTRYFPNHKTFEFGTDIIKHGENGFCSDSIPELQDCARMLLKDRAFAQRISTAARQTGIELFGKETIKEQWRNFLSSLA